MANTDIIARGMAGGAKKTADTAYAAALDAAVKKGYLYDGSFYNDSAHTSLITPSEGKTYYDYDGKHLYVYDGAQYVEVGGDAISTGRFLSNWDCEAGLPESEPFDVPYTYTTGDYYIVSNVPADVTLYRPHGSIYDGTPSLVEETDDVSNFDFYFFDSDVWLLLKNSQALKDVTEDGASIVNNGIAQISVVHKVVLG